MRLIICSEGRQEHDGRRTAQVTGFESLPQEEIELDLDDAQFLDLNQTGKEETILEFHTFLENFIGKKTLTAL